jgi:hypothetical protein
VKIKLAIILTLALAVISATAGCDRQAVIRGKVFEWVNPSPGARSLILDKEYTYQGLLNENIPADADLRPLKDVMINCYGKIKADTFYSNEISDEKGDFKLLTRLGQITEDYPATIEAVKAGYEKVRREIVDTGSSHTITIIMVKE